MALINGDPVELTADEFDFAIKDYNAIVRIAAVRRDLGHLLTSKQVDYALSDDVLDVAVAVLKNGKHPISKEQFDYIFSKKSMGLRIEAINHAQWQPTSSQIDFLCNLEPHVIRALMRNDKVRFTRKQVILGLSRGINVRIEYASSNKFEMDNEIAEICLSDDSFYVRAAFAARPDISLNKEQQLNLLLDSFSEVRIAALMREDLILDDEMVACRKTNLSEDEDNAWRQAIARSTLNSETSNQEAGAPKIGPVRRL